MPAIDRTPREKEARETTQRERPWTPPGSFPMEILSKDPNVRYRWVRTHLNSAEEDKTSIYKRFQAGWRPVLAEEVPEFEYLRDTMTNQIRLGGCVLCKNSVENTQRIEKYYHDQAVGQLNGAASEFEQSQDTRVPRFSEGTLKTRIIR